MEELRTYFSVNTMSEFGEFDENATGNTLNEYTEKMKCMPCAFPRALTTVDKIYKTYKQMFFDSKKVVEIRCDFIED